MNTTKRYYPLEAVFGCLLFVAVVGAFQLNAASEEIDEATNKYVNTCARFDRQIGLYKLQRQVMPTRQASAEGLRSN